VECFLAGLDADRRTFGPQAHFGANPAHLSVYLRIACIHLQGKSPEKALAILDKAEKQFPDQARISYLRALAHREAGELDKAIQDYTATVQRAKPGDNIISSSFYVEFGALCEQSGQFDQAAEHLRKAIELDQKNATALNYLGYMWANRGINLDEAMDLIRKALAIEPRNGAYIDSLGWVFFKQGKYQEALVQLEKAAHLIENEDDVVFDHLAETHFHLKNYREAVKFWEKCLTLKPDKTDYQRKLEEAKAKAGKEQR